MPRLLVLKNNLPKKLGTQDTKIGPELFNVTPCSRFSPSDIDHEIFEVFSAMTREANDPLSVCPELTSIKGPSVVIVVGKFIAGTAL